MNDELTKKIFGIKSKGRYGNIVLSTENPNPNSFLKNLIGEDNGTRWGFSPIYCYGIEKYLEQLKK